MLTVWHSDAKLTEYAHDQILKGRYPEGLILGNIRLEHSIRRDEVYVTVFLVEPDSDKKLIEICRYSTNDQGSIVLEPPNGGYMSQWPIKPSPDSPSRFLREETPYDDVINNLFNDEEQDD